jgi:iron complex outermembrane recepter protein
VRNNGTNPAPALQSSTRSIDRPSWRISLDHEFSDTVLGYASYNRGFKSGGYNITQPAAPAYDPETLDAYEVGLKTELFDRSIRLNTAGFYYKYSDLQLTKVVAGSLTIVNAASAKLYGLEADFEARLTPAFKLIGGISLIHSEFTKFDNAQFISLNPAGGLITTVGDASGNRLQLAQEISASITASYSRELSFGKIDLSVTESYNGDYFFDPDNFARQPGYHMINASAGWTSLSGDVTTTIFARNLLNEKVIGQVSSATAIGLTATYPYAPRVVGISFRYRF